MPPGHSRLLGGVLPAGPDDVPLGLADSMLGWSLASPEVGDADALDGVPAGLAEFDPDGVGEADELDDDPDDDELDGDDEELEELDDELDELDDCAEDDCDDDGGGVVGTGGCGGSGGAFMNSSTAMSRAIAATSNSSNQLASRLTQPARCVRPGHGRGQVRVAPGRSLPIHDSR